MQVGALSARLLARERRGAARHNGGLWRNEHFRVTTVPSLTNVIATAIVRLRRLQGTGTVNYREPHNKKLLATPCALPPIRTICS